jgi:hypothetical protein
VPNPSEHEPASLLYLLTMGLAVYQAQRAKGLAIVIGLVLGHKALFFFNLMIFNIKY